MKSSVPIFAKITATLALLKNTPLGAGDRLATRCAGRAAFERVYYIHRLGGQPPFEQVSPASLIARLMKDNLRKEATLNKAYGLEVSVVELDSEVQRINATTRAPELQEAPWAALGNDPVRFARTVAK